ncbi:MAG: ABC-type nitrate/sulfonate/bicarbonate transport system, permease component [Paenibacillaceae bacterium]|nr:ABC-type nitrate/sulfonate/bicarbonate transport system, permease component [Paenibacillaceae bacterium]
MAVAVFWLLVWHGVYLLVDRELYLPSPLSVLERLSGLVREPLFWKDTGMSVVRIVCGFALSVAAAAVLGVLSGLNAYVHMLLNPLVTAIKATPVMSFIMIALFWFSSGRVPVFICFLMCFPIVWTHMVEGIRSLDRSYLEMTRVFRVKLSVRIRRVYLPSLIPFFSPACLTALGFGWKVGVAAEVLSHPKNSIGSHLYEAKAYLDSTELFAWTLVVIALSMLFEKTFSILIRRLKSDKKAVMIADA